MNFRPRHISSEDFEAMQNRVRGRSALPDRGVTLEHARVGPASRQCNAMPPSPYKYKGYRSKLEYNWANYLNGLIALGSIANFYYEPFNIRLPGKKNFYNPDFMVLAGDGITFYEIKGRNKSDDRSLVKIKTAAGIHKWAQFVVVKWIKGQWEERSIA